MHMPNIAPPISTAEAAVRLGVGRRYVLDLIREGKLPAHKLPGRTGAYVVNPADVEALRAARATKAAS